MHTLCTCISQPEEVHVATVYVTAQKVDLLQLTNLTPSNVHAHLDYTHDISYM